MERCGSVCWCSGLQITQFLRRQSHSTCLIVVAVTSIQRWAELGYPQFWEQDVTWGQIVDLCVIWSIMSVCQWNPSPSLSKPRDLWGPGSFWCSAVPSFDLVASQTANQPQSCAGLFYLSATDRPSLPVEFCLLFCKGWALLIVFDPMPCKPVILGCHHHKA